MAHIRQSRPLYATYPTPLTLTVDPIHAKPQPQQLDGHRESERLGRGRVEGLTEAQMAHTRQSRPVFGPIQDSHGQILKVNQSRPCSGHKKAWKGVRTLVAAESQASARPKRATLSRPPPLRLEKYSRHHVVRARTFRL